jgi:hypothetical protein
MDGGRGTNEAVVGWGGDEAAENSAPSSTARQTSIPPSKKRYKKLGIANFVLHCLILLQIIDLIS